jgi:hypothetical protein
MHACVCAETVPAGRGNDAQTSSLIISFCFSSYEVIMLHERPHNVYFQFLLFFDKERAAHMHMRHIFFGYI